MVDMENLIIGYYQLIVGLAIMVVMILGILRYKEKKSKVAKMLMIAFTMMFIAVICQTSVTLSNAYELDRTVLPLFENALVHKFFWGQFFQYRHAYYFLLLGIYFLSMFSLEIIAREGEKKGFRMMAVIVLIILLVYGVFIEHYITAGGELISIIKGIDIWVIIYALVMMFPILSESGKLRKKIPKNNPAHKKIGYIMLFTISFLLTVLAFILETIFPLIGGSMTISGININPFSYFAWTFAVFALIFSYLGLYKKD